MSTVYNIGPTWKGFQSIRRLVIFGDSYSSVERMLGNDGEPSASQPLGVPFPGFTYNEVGQPNWVGHLITKYCPEPRYIPTAAQQTEAWNRSPLLVYDYAEGGSTVPRVCHQIEKGFLQERAAKPSWTSWAPQETLFVTWVGINDLAFTLQPGVLAKLFEYQEMLYTAGARNFLFFDVPTIHLSPAVPVSREQQTLVKFEGWNAHLQTEVKKFSESHSDASVFIFSSFRAFEVLFENLEIFGFNVQDGKRRAGSVWMDHLHPRSKVHDHIAQSVATFLAEIPSSSTS
ncbi:unnamed protein product [Cyclocybe aegerita]|uniref:Carbohydrate esterase family 16 protein n=1 Tax=Cyclocybe aegerita TaxID=1973307 RepID=A0A8S0Y129_CYCAE|nr:unnamed protein product [Cyclocybe aegerita]